MSAAPRRDTILLDMDGLMVDTEPLYWEVVRQLAARRGRSVEDATLRRMMGRSRMESMGILKADTGLSESPEALLEEREAMMLDRYARGVEPMPGLRDFLARFAGRATMAVVTSSPRKFTDVLLPGLGIDRCFALVQTGDGVTRGKPDPEIYLTAMGKLGATAAECVVLEDSRAGALAGKSAGAYVVAVPSHLTAGEDFSFADHRCADLQDAMAHVDGLMH